MQLPAISKHIKVLEQAGLIVRSRHAQFRPCRLAPDRLAEVATWADQYRAIWDDRFDRLDQQLAPAPHDSADRTERTNDR